MGKNAKFSGQPIFSQLINFIPKDSFARIVSSHQADRYVKKFDSFHHLVTMIYAQFQNCNSLREIEIGMLACKGKLNHLGVQHLPKRSTLAEANSRRTHEIFQDLYFSILDRYKQILSDSRNSWLDKRLYILDATVISLFQDILPVAGRPRNDGRRKGGVKVHALLNASYDVPEMIVMKAAADADRNELFNIKLPTKSILVFDKGYVNFDQFNRFTSEEITWVTRKTASWVIEVIDEKKVDLHQEMNGVLSDQVVIVGNKTNKKQVRVRARLVKFYDAESKREFEFVTNNFTMSPTTIAQIYQKRWQVELLFKRIKQNSQLYNFLGDNVNAIKIQIWCSLIADLITKIVQKQTKVKYAYSNIATLIRLHFLSYVELFKFLNNPKLEFEVELSREKQITLFSSG